MREISHPQPDEGFALVAYFQIPAFDDPMAARAESLGFMASLQLGQIFLTSLWATIALIEEAIRKGSTPMFIIRTIEPAAVVV
jgi:hypothetical protein